MKFIGTTVARTLIVVATLVVLFAGYMLLYRLPRQRAQDEWDRCARPHVVAAEQAKLNYDVDGMGKALQAARACGDPP